MDIIFDIETDGLLENVTKIHCLSYLNLSTNKIISLTSYAEIIELFNSPSLKTIIGHNIILYDIPVLEKILKIKIKQRAIDTLGLSWYLYPDRNRHGLEYWGDDLGVKKPTISDWSNLDIQEYKHRCESDVRINTLLFTKEMGYLNKLYEKDVDRIINYISFKLDCAREQEEVKCKINKGLVKKSLKELEDLREQKTEIIKRVMPKKVIFKTVSKPQKMYLKNGSLSSLGEKWMSLLQSQNLPQDYDNSVSYVISEEVGNPNSKDQLKDWLFSIGWKPITFEYRVNKAGETKEVPQIYNKIGVDRKSVV